MKTIKSNELVIGKPWQANGILSDWAYCAMDSLVTDELIEVMLPLLEPQHKHVYDFVRGMQAPALAMMKRGIRIDQVKRSELISLFYQQREHCLGVFNEMTQEGFGTQVNYRSSAQLKSFFYETMGLPEVQIYDHVRRVRRVSTNREALEKLLGYFQAQPIVRAILILRDIEKKIQVLESGIDGDGRMRCSFNVASASTGRWSSSANVFGGGTNFQNITDEMREMFVADSGKKLAYVDLEQAESKEVAFKSGDENYLAACLSGDLHTYVARLIWPRLAWTGNLAQDKQVAEQPFYRQFSYRDMSKRGGHATNYDTTPNTLAQHLKIELSVAVGFQEVYYRTFPGIKDYQNDCARRAASDRSLVNPFGRRIWFFGRPSDRSTIREFIAAEPQSAVGDALNIGLFKLWLDMDVEAGEIDILAQVHDAVLLQYDENREDQLIPIIKRKMLVPHMVTDIHGTTRELTIPTEASVGWNWRKRKDKKGKDGSIKVENPSGLLTYHGPDKRIRPPASEEISPLDQRVCRTH